MTRGDNHDKGLFEWGSLLVYTVISILWFALSLWLQAINDRITVRKVQDSIKEVSCQLCSRIQGNGYSDLSCNMAEGWPRVQASSKPIPAAFDRESDHARVDMLVSGVPSTWCPTLPSAVNVLPGPSDDCKAMGECYPGVGRSERRNVGYRGS